MDGYYRLSTLIGQYPELAIFRRFTTLNVLNLLVLQAEIDQLGQALGKSAHDQRIIDIAAGRHPLDESINDLKCEWSTQGNLQYGIMLQLRQLLPVYSTSISPVLTCFSPLIAHSLDDALLKWAAVSRLSGARKCNLNTLQAWLKDPSGGHNFLRGTEENLWNYAPDLVSLQDSRHSKSAFSKWLSEKFIVWFHKHIGHRFKKHELPLYEPAFSDTTLVAHLVNYSEDIIDAFVTGASTLLSAILPCLAIFLLYYVHTPVIRLSIILILSLLFSIASVFFGDAKKSKESSFATNSAFVAVLVVFVGSAGTSGSSYQTH